MVLFFMLPIKSKKINNLLKKTLVPKSMLNSCNFGYKYASQHITENTQKVLELGCGSCLLLAVLSQKYKNKIFFGIDPNLKAFSSFGKLRLALIKNFRLSVTEEYSSNLIPDDIDLIFCVDVLEHVENVNDVFIFCKKKLSKDGKLIIICPNAAFPYEPHFSIPIIINKEITYKIFQKKINHIELRNKSSGLWKSLNFITADKLEYLAKSYGFKIKFYSNLSEEVVLRVAADKDFMKRKPFVWFLAFFAAKFSLSRALKYKFLTKFLPYIYAEITLQ